MPARRKLLIASLAIATTATLTTTDAHAEDCAASTTPAACYLAAAHAAKDASPGEAAKLYLASYRIEPKIDPLAGYGLSLAIAKDYVAAADALEKAAEEYEKLEVKFRESNADASTMFAVVHRLELVREELRKLAPHIGRVRLETALPAGVTVIRKGGDDVRGSDPTKLIVKPGGDVLVFTYPSGRTLELPVNIGGGLITTVAVPAEPPPPAIAPARDEIGPPIDPGAKHQRWAYIAGGAGIGLVVLGFGYTFASDATRFEITGALVGTGLVGIGAGAYLWYLAGEKRKGGATTAMVPVVSDRIVGAMFTTSF